MDTSGQAGGCGTADVRSKLMTEKDVRHSKPTIGGSLTFRLPHAIVVALLGIAIATAVAIANS